jgi:hypothetical protein
MALGKRISQDVTLILSRRTIVVQVGSCFGQE